MDNVVSKYCNIFFGERYILSIGIQDIQGKLQQIARLVILRASLFGLKRLKRDEFSLKIILYHLFCYVNVITNVLVGEFGEI